MLSYSCTSYHSDDYDNSANLPVVEKSIDYMAAIDQLKAESNGIEGMPERLSIFYTWATEHK